MRVRIDGEGPVADGLRGLLQREGFQLVRLFASVSLRIEPSPAPDEVRLDGVDGEWERLLLAALVEAFGSVRVSRPARGGHASRATVSVPQDEAGSFRAQRAIVRALCWLRRAR